VVFVKFFKWVFFGCILFGNANSSASVEQPNVLLVMQESPHLSWNKSFLDVFEDRFFKTYPQGHLFYEYFDLDRLPIGSHDIYRALLSEKYKPLGLDAILMEGEDKLSIVSQNQINWPNAAYFVMQHNESTLELPSDRIIHELLIQSNYTKLLMQAHDMTDADNIVLVGKATKRHGSSSVHELRDKISLGGRKVSITSLEFTTMMELQKRLDALKGKVAVVLTPFFVNTNSRNWTPAEVSENIAKSIDYPVFVHWDNMLNDYVVGGFVISGEGAAREMANGIIEHIRGSSPRLQSQNVFASLYNVQTLEQFGIDLFLLPAQSQLYNKPTSAIDVFFTEIMAASIIMLILLSVTLVLLSWNRRLNQQQGQLYESEQALVYSNERMQVATSVTQLGIWEYVIASETLEWDTWMFRHHDKRKQTFQPSLQAWLDCIFEQDVSNLKTNFLFSINKGKQLAQDYRVETVSGTRFLSVNADVIIDINNKPVRLVGTVRDISEQVLHEQRLQEARRKAEVAAKIKSNFVANMSQEIRAPLNTIMGTTELLNSTSLDTKQHSYLALMQSSTKSLVHIVNDVLDLSKLESGKMSVEKYSFNLHEFLEHTLASHQSMAQQKNLRLTHSVDASVPQFIISDAFKIKQILTCLIDNAIKFTSLGYVLVNVQYISEENDEHTGSLVCEVSDTGIGIATNALDRIFEKFQQSEKDTFQRYGGTGLGLNICRHLTQLLDGKVSVESELHKGSMFTVSIPVTVPKNGHANNTPQLDTLNLLGKRILIVDDVEINRLIMGQMLNDTSADIVYAENGKQAVRLFASQSFDLVLMDVLMPIMDGLEATKIMRSTMSEFNSNSIPIISLTAHAAPGDREMCIEAGMNDYLNKPISRYELFELLRKTLLSS